MMALWCVTDGAAIYSVGETQQAALADFHKQVDNEVREGYFRDGLSSLIQISPELYDRVLRDGGNLDFDIDGNGRHAIAVTSLDEN